MQRPDAAEDLPKQEGGGGGEETGHHPQTPVMQVTEGGIEA